MSDAGKNNGKGGADRSVRARRVAIRASLVVAYLALTVFTFLSGRGHTLLLDNKSLPDGSAQAFRRVKVYVDGRDPVELYARDRDLLTVTGQTHRVRIETQEGAARTEATFTMDLETDMILLSVPGMAAGLDDFWEPFVVEYERPAQAEEPLPTLETPAALEPSSP